MNFPQSTIEHAPAQASARAAAMEAIWRRRGPAVLKTAAILLAVASAVWLSYQFWRLLFQGGRLGALDLGLRYIEVKDWFAGCLIYWTHLSAVYPPATQLILWPLLGWIPGFTMARWLWGAIAVAAAARLSTLAMRESGATTPAERRVAALIPLGTYALGAGIGNGQIIVPLIVIVLMQLPAMLERARREPTWGHDLWLAGAFLFCLVKPSLTAPFFWLVLIVPRRVRPAALVVAAYLALTLFSASFQPVPFRELIGRWLHMSSRGLEMASAQTGYGTVNNMLGWLHLPTWNSTVSLLILGALGLWLWWMREAPLWLLLGEAAIVSRLWVYHNWYDDFVLLPTVIVLFRLAKGRDTSLGVDWTAGLLFGALIGLSIAPGGHYLFPEPLRSLYVGVLLLLWFAILGFLAQRAWIAVR
jgi:hypothetical protein